MASEQIFSFTSPDPQYSPLFRRALLAALGAHALALVALSLFTLAFSSSSAPAIQAPVISASVSLLALAPASSPSSPSSPPSPPAPTSLTRPPSPRVVKPVAAAQLPEPSGRVQAPEPPPVPQPSKAAESANPSDTPQPVTRSSQAAEASPVKELLNDATASVAASKAGLPEARVRASAQCVAPSYPRRSVVNNEQRVSQIELRIGEDGRVRESKIAQSSGFFRLDQAALQALSACEFEPERVNGVAREAWARIRYVWRLD
jgi:protein TonB